MISRREFLASTALSTAGLAISPLTSAASYSRSPGANQKPNIACVGIGNRGEQIIEDFEKTGLVNVVAICDVDMGAPHTTKIMEKYPKAKRYQDFRQMLDKRSEERRVGKEGR